MGHGYIHRVILANSVILCPMDDASAIGHVCCMGVSYIVMLQPMDEQRVMGPVHWC